MLPVQDPIDVYIGSADEFRCCEHVIEHSIKAHASVDTNIHFIRPETLGVRRTGCTGFTNLRYAVPHLNNYCGFAVYLDVDMILMGDIAELYEYREAGKWVTLADGSDEVSIISCGTHPHMPKVGDIHRYHKSELKEMVRQSAKIPLCWNVEDRVEAGMKLLHFTDLKTQPWRTRHPNEEAESIWLENLSRASVGR